MTAEATQAPSKATLKDAIRAYSQPKMAMMLVLGFAAGLPFLLYYSTLSVRLEKSEVDSALISFFSFFGLSYSLKFFWAPLVDRFDPPGLARLFGRRRAWIFTAQVGVALGLAGLGFSDPTVSLAGTALFSFLVAFSSATQDIGVDAWRIEAAADEDEQAPLAAAYQYGYKVGLVMAGGVALFIAGVANWSVAYFAMSGLVVVAAFVFAIWDRRFGVHAAAAAGVAIIALGFAVAGDGLSALTPDSGLGASLFQLLSMGFTAIAAIAGAAFLFYGLLALRNPASGPEFKVSDLLVGLGFAGAFFGAVTLAAAAIGLGVPAFLNLIDVTVTKSDIGRLATYVAVTPLIACALAIPVIRRIPAESATLQHPTWGPFLDFFWRHGWAALAIFAFVSTYRLSDIVMGIEAKKAYSWMGYDEIAIGLVSGTYGPWIVFIGVAAAGLSALWLGLQRSLVIGAIVSILGNVVFAWLVNQSSDSLTPLFIAITADNIAGGYAGTIFVAYMSTLVNRSFAGTQYAIFSSVWSLGPKLIAGTSGLVVGAVGYSDFFLYAAAIGLPAVVLSMLVDRMRPDRDSVLRPAEMTR